MELPPRDAIVGAGTAGTGTAVTSASLRLVPESRTAPTASVGTPPSMPGPTAGRRPVGQLPPTHMPPHHVAPHHPPPATGSAADAPAAIRDDLLPGVGSADSLPRPGLSHREQQVLRTWLLTDSKAEVADSLSISMGTVNTHLARIRTKYAAVGRRAGTKAALAARAIQDGLISLDEL